jgi:hypothetical protein
MKASARNVNRKFSELQILYLAKSELYELSESSDFRTAKTQAEMSQILCVFEIIKLCVLINYCASLKIFIRNTSTNEIVPSITKACRGTGKSGCKRLNNLGLVLGFRGTV